MDRMNNIHTTVADFKENNEIGFCKYNKSYISNKQNEIRKISKKIKRTIHAIFFLKQKIFSFSCNNAVEKFVSDYDFFIKKFLALNKKILMLPLN